jgi:hypothetical protein
MVIMKHSSRLATTVVAVAAVALGGCSGPSGVTVSDDWSGAEAFVLARVDGLTTVVGVDPVHHTASSLAVVAAQHDDDTVRSPQILELAGGTWVVSIPKKDQKPSRLYTVDRKSHALDVAGTVEAERSLVRTGASVAAVSAASASTAGQAEALMYDPASWHSGRALPIPVDPGLAAGGTGHLCVAQSDDTASTVVLIPTGGSGRIVTTRVPRLQAQALTCGTGATVVAGGPAADRPATDATVRLTRTGGLEVLTASAGRVDRIATATDTITAVVALPDSTRILTVRRSDGAVTAQASVKGLGGATGLRRTSAGWLLTSGDEAAVVTMATGQVHTFKLPGELLSAD